MRLEALASCWLHLRGATPTAALAWLWAWRKSLAAGGSIDGGAVVAGGGAALWAVWW